MLSRWTSSGPSASRSVRAAAGTRGVDTATVVLDQVMYDREPEAKTPMAPRMGPVDLVESAEDVR